MSDSGDVEPPSRPESIRSRVDLEVWQRAHGLAVRGHSLAGRPPPDEAAQLLRRIRRSSAAAPSNIAEGNGFLMRGDYLRHPRVAHGSLRELQDQLVLVRDIPLPGRSALTRDRQLSEQVRQMLTALIWKLKREPDRSPGSRFPHPGGR